MIPEIGNFSLILAFVLAMVLGVLPIVGSLIGNGSLMALAKPVARGQLASGRRGDARSTLERVVSLNRQPREAQEAAQLLETMR